MRGEFSILFFTMPVQMAATKTQSEPIRNYPLFTSTRRVVSANLLPTSKNCATFYLLVFVCYKSTL